MRFVMMTAALLALAACDQVPTAPADSGASHDTALTPDNGSYDYRYAFRLPGGRIAAVQESHQRGCEQLGPARCRITAMRYKVDDQNHVSAILTVRIDPALARAYGKAASQVVTGANGTLVDADVAGGDAAGRSDSVIARLNEAQGNAEAQLRNAALPADQRAQIAARLDRIRGAIATISEVDQSAGDSIATTPLIFTYASGGSMLGVPGNADGSFDAAGETFMASLAGLANVLAGVGPWAILLLGGALILRRIVQSGEEAAEAPVLPPAPRDPPEHEHRGVIQRWFSREPEEREPEPVS
jgi:hypothetical protein